MSVEGRQCDVCEEWFADTASIGSEHDLCQDCWERECAGLFWELISIEVPE